MRTVSLRTLILATVLTTIVIALGAFSVYLDRAERGNRVSDIDTELVRAERASIGGPRRLEPSPPSAVDSDDVGAPVQLVVGADGSLLGEPGAMSPFSPDLLANLVAEDGNHTTNSPRYRVRITTMPDGSVAVTALPLDDLDAAVGRFRTALAVGGAVIVALVAVVLWLLAGFLSRPVTRLTEAAGRIAAGDLETPVETSGGPRETIELAVDLDSMVSRLRLEISRSDEARQATERLLADLAHEIRTPLTALKGYSDLYARGMLETHEDVSRAMGRIGSESQRLSDLATSMLELARHGSHATRTETIDVAALVDDVLSDLRAAYPNQSIELRTDTASPLLVTGAPEGLHQALLNIGSNACQHAPADTPIKVRTGRLGDAVVIAISDHGPGVEPDQRSKIFEPFFRTDAARARDGNHGAGLGLALSHRIADQHSGVITISTTPGGGATFTFSVPIASGLSQ